MPVGDSVTRGWEAGAPPPAGHHGYRDHLYRHLTNAGPVQFAGPDAASPYFDAAYHDPPWAGFFRDSVRIRDFLPGGRYDILAMLAAMPVDAVPDLMILHAGSYDMTDTGAAIGDHQTPGTVACQLCELLHGLLAFEKQGRRVNRILLCYIIPFSPFMDRPVLNRRVLAFNAAVEYMVQTMAEEYRDRITVVDMFSAFRANESIYQDAHRDPLHPNAQGYRAMGDLLAYHLVPRSAYIRENFSTRGPLHGHHRWTAGPALRIHEDGFAFCSDTSGSDWKYPGIWAPSEDACAITMKIPSEECMGNFQAMALAVGLNDTLPDRADGYMVWISGERLRIHTLRDGRPHENALFGGDTYAMAGYSPGDSLFIRFRPGTAGQCYNYFDIRVNDQKFHTLCHHTTTWGRPETGWNHYYAGLMFQGRAGLGDFPGVDFLKVHTVQPVFSRSVPVEDLEVLDSGSGRVTLTWTSPGNGGLAGRAARYDMRMARQPIDGNACYQADVVFGLSKPLPQASPEILTINGLESGLIHYFRVRVIDEYGHAGPWSNEAACFLEAKQEDAPDSTTFTMNHLPDWNFDPDEYNLDPDYPDEISAPGNTGKWAGGLMVCKTAARLHHVSLVWGGAVTPGEDAPVPNGGLALGLTDNQPDAGGYLIMVSPHAAAVQLWLLENGRPDSLLDASPYRRTGGSGDLIYPAAGDTMTVVMNALSRPEYRFTVYINRRPAAVRSLTGAHDFSGSDGNCPPDSASGNAGSAAVDYSLQPCQGFFGILLAEVHGIENRNNNVKAVLTEDRPGIPEYLFAAGLTYQNGTAGEALHMPFGVRVLDAYGSTVPGTPVQWRVVQGDGRVIPETDTTNHEGLCLASVIPGETDSLTVIQAEYEGYAGRDVLFTCRAAGLPGLTEIDRRQGDLPRMFFLHQNYPNPFNPDTEIAFDLPERDYVSMTVYNIGGKRVRTLLDGDMEAGCHTCGWDGRDERNRRVSTGLYFYRLQWRDRVQVRRMMLMK